MSVGLTIDYQHVTEHEYHGQKKKLKFLPGEYEDVFFVVTNSRAERALVVLLAPILRVLLSVRRRTRRQFSTSTPPPDGR